MPLGDPNVAFAAKIGAARAQNEFIKIVSIARSGLAARRRCGQTTALAESLGGPGRRVSCAGLASRGAVDERRPLEGRQTEAARASHESAAGEAAAAPLVSRQYAEGICAREWFGDVV